MGSKRAAYVSTRPRGRGSATRPRQLHADGRTIALSHGKAGRAWSSGPNSRDVAGFIGGRGPSRFETPAPRFADTRESGCISPVGCPVATQKGRRAGVPLGPWRARRRPAGRLHDHRRAPHLSFWEMRESLQGTMALIRAFEPREDAAKGRNHSCSPGRRRHDQQGLRVSTRRFGG